MPDSVHHHLQERIKELTALHGTARLLQESHRPLDDVLRDVLSLLPAAWQYPEVTEARIVFEDRQWQSARFGPSPWSQREDFTLRDGTPGCLEVIYTAECPAAHEGPFMAEERDLIRSLSEMLRASFQHRQDDAEILAANERLEKQVAERTASLRRLASELCLAEERERRQIAENLHDHLGQGLALIRMRLQNLRGDAVFGGHGDALGELITLSEQAIRYTRNLTFEVSPPVLYELGLGAALDWLGEQTARKHGLKIRVRDRLRVSLPETITVMYWKSARELLHNVIKHAEAKKVSVELLERDGRVILRVEDNGRGFDLEAARREAGDRFGLFSIEMRLRQMGGHVTVRTAPGRGTLVSLETPLPEG